LGFQQPYRKQIEINHEDKFKIKKLLKNEIEKKKRRKMKENEGTK
jgi:hypothetical protein